MLASTDDIPPQRPAESPALNRQDAGDWYVCHTKSNLEWRLARELLRLGLDYFLPVSETVTRDAARRRTISVVPLFKNYLFLRGDEFSPGKAYGTFCCRNVIRVVNQPRIRHDLLNLENCIAVNPRIERCDLAVKGRIVRVTCGPFEGLEGEVIRRGKCDLLVIGVDGVGKAVMEIPMSKLEAA